MEIFNFWYLLALIPSIPLIWWGVLLFKAKRLRSDQKGSVVLHQYQARLSQEDKTLTATMIDFPFLSYRVEETEDPYVRGTDIGVLKKRTQEGVQNFLSKKWLFPFLPAPTPVAAITMDLERGDLGLMVIPIRSDRIPFLNMGMVPRKPGQRIAITWSEYVKATLETQRRRMEENERVRKIKAAKKQQKDRNQGTVDLTKLQTSYDQVREDLKQKGSSAPN